MFLGYVECCIFLGWLDPGQSHRPEVSIEASECSQSHVDLRLEGCVLCCEAVTPLGNTTSAWFLGKKWVSYCKHYFFTHKILKGIMERTRFLG